MNRSLKTPILQQRAISYEIYTRWRHRRYFPHRALLQSSLQYDCFNYIRGRAKAQAEPEQGTCVGFGPTQLPVN